ncbi:hypothetical protein K2173_001180 [Erythroxylum novogranatense]|uniref:Major facilitator superfamily (MFS) profile domain-containing protein n=1 Tax=Erythroxylum novogranatense TaxID=1862640 RepID=A0AAV8TIJ0_9ROSI|nr:hypothetical protein K2173_001180 [Erythroxylum novogranatense]
MNTHYPSSWFAIYGSSYRLNLSFCSSSSPFMATEEGPSYTVDEALEALGFGKFQVLVLVYAGMGWVSDAMEMMILSFVGSAVRSQWKLNANQESLITTVVFAGLLVGSFSWGQVSDIFGRRRGYLVTALVTSVAGLLSSFSPNYACLIAARCFVGIGLGGVPVLISYFLEFVPAPNRGAWMMVFSAFWSVGTVSEAGLAWIVMPRLGWRWLVGLSSVPSFLLLLFYIVTPESPRYLCLKGRKDDAHKIRKIMQKIARLNGKELPPGVLVADHERKQMEVEDVPHKDSESPPQIADKHVPIIRDSALGPVRTFLLLLSQKLRRSTLLLWFLFFVNSLAYYGLVLLTTELNNSNNKCHSTTQATNKSSSSDGVDYKNVFVTTFAEFPGVVIAALTLDRIGRKLTMVGMFMVAGAFVLPLVVHHSPAVTTALLFVARMCINGTFSTIFVYAPEIYPTSVRTTGVGLSSAMGRVGGMVCPLVAVSLVQSCHLKEAVGLFAGVIFVAGLCVFLFPYETKGRQLIESVSSSPSSSADHQSP